MTDPPPPGPDDLLEPEPLPRLEPEQVGAWVWNRAKADGKDRDRELRTDLDLGRRSEEGARRSLELVRRELPSHLDPHDLAQAGWGVIFPRGGARRLKEPLRALLELRERQAKKKLFHTFTYTKGEGASAFLARHREIIGTIRPERVPYYLLIVGSPEEIPFEFQYQLSLNHAVGRIDFESPADYRRYAEAVRDAETGGVDLPRRAELFSAEYDDTTRLLGKYLVRPLHRCLEDGFSGWTVESRRKSQATKARLHKLLGGKGTPGLLLVSCHGLRVHPRFEHQEAYQGALCCQPKGDEKPRFAAADLPPDADLHGLISFFFACYGAGTPKLDDFPHEDREPKAVLRTEPRLVSLRPFLARLPRDLLSRGALAVVGHVDRGWTYSFVWDMGTRDVGSVESLEDSLRLLLRGHRLGHALRPLHRRYCQLAARLALMLDPQRIGVEPDLARLGIYWTAVNDARNFIIVGDPAVYLLGQRLPPSGGGSSHEDVFRLEPDLLPLVQARAKRTNTSVETWINQTLARILRRR